MIAGFAELPMYPAPEPIHTAAEAWIAHTLQLLGAQRRPWRGENLHRLFREPDLLFAQTCGYPLMTGLQDRVRLVGRPDFDLPYCAGGEHHSLLLVRERESRCDLATLRGCRGAANSADSNTGMNLLRHALAPWHLDGRFFTDFAWSGSHRQSLRWLREGRADLIAVDSVTFAYLQFHAAEEIQGVRVLQLSAPSPTLPYITTGDESQARQIREALNRALEELPQVAGILHIRQVLPASPADYEILLRYEKAAVERGLATLHPGA